MSEQRYDSAPEGWAGTVEQMKGKPGVDNPFALAHWMANQGFTPHDAMDSVTLDAACEMYGNETYGNSDSAHDDGLPYETAGAKEGNGGPADTWTAQTENLEEIPEHEDDEVAPLAGPGAESGEAMAKHGDDDEMLLDDSESEVGIFPTGATPNVGNNANSIGQHGSISDPEPEVSGAAPLNVGGVETNDDDEEERETDDSDDEDMAY
jgi:hypothetical protein